MRHITAFIIVSSYLFQSVEEPNRARKVDPSLRTTRPCAAAFLRLSPRSLFLSALLLSLPLLFPYSCSSSRLRNDWRCSHPQVACNFDERPARPMLTTLFRES